MSIYGLNDFQLTDFRMMHSEIIQYYQCIEYDMKLIFSAMKVGDFDDNMDLLEMANWGEVLSRLQLLDFSDGKPLLSKQDYEYMDELRDDRNYWCHQCYLDFVYESNYSEQQRILHDLYRELERDKKRAYDLHQKLLKAYNDHFCR